MLNFFKLSADHFWLRRKALMYLVAGMGVLVLILFLSWADWDVLKTWLRGLNPFWLFTLMVIVPLLGGPVSLFYLAAGIRFGPWWGLLWALLAVAIHLIGSWWIANSWMQRPLDWLCDKLNYKKPMVPKGEYAPVCLLVSLVPGILYAAKNYLLVLAGVPFRPYFYTCLPAHFFHAALGILLGDLIGATSWLKTVFFITYAVVLLGLSHYVVHRLKRAGTGGGSDVT